MKIDSKLSFTVLYNVQIQQETYLTAFKLPWWRTERNTRAVLATSSPFGDPKVEHNAPKVVHGCDVSTVKCLCGCCASVTLAN